MKSRGDLERERRRVHRRARRRFAARAASGFFWGILPALFLFSLGTLFFCIHGLMGLEEGETRDRGDGMPPEAVFAGNGIPYPEGDMLSLDLGPTDLSVEDLVRIREAGVSYGDGLAEAWVTLFTLARQEFPGNGGGEPYGWHATRFGDCPEVFVRQQLIPDFLYASCHGDRRNLCLATVSAAAELDGFYRRVREHVLSTGEAVALRARALVPEGGVVPACIVVSALSEGGGFSSRLAVYVREPGTGIDYLSGDSWKIE